MLCYVMLCYVMLCYVMLFGGAEKNLNMGAQLQTVTYINQRNVRQFLHILAFPGYAPGTIAVNVTWMERRFNACQTHCSMHIPIYLQPFTSYSEILVGNCNFFLPLAFNAPRWGVPIGILGKVWITEN